ncbi:hypothetical protein KOR34_35240 [Posidoniimonas corsicana]|uniref:Chromosome partition protein Smc n=1 Tax=Posidoniimonas corsicana TaxID=1938618 RepID=A0A5C5V5V5_9BACT|nr:hypothetical protein [Posidoniimonas corsicana]TWT33691.1 hypothetical protein KOR34_35240 [Posidoniimonas corsicana]
MLRPMLTLGLILAAAPVLAAETDPLEGKRHAKQLFQVDPRSPAILTGQPTLSLSDAKIYRATQPVMIKSERVLGSALRTTDFNDSGLFPNKDTDEVEWVRERLVVDFPDGSNVMTIAFVHPTAPRDAMVELVGAIGKAYLDEVVFEAKIQRQKPRDILAASYRDLDEEIKRKTDTYDALLRDMPSVRLPEMAAKVGLLKDQIGRLQAEKLSAERELLGRRIEIKQRDLSAKQKAERLTTLIADYGAYTSQLDKQVAALTKEVLELSEDNSGAAERAEQIETLKKVRNQIAEKIEQWNVELKTPDTVRPFHGVEFHDPSEKDDAKRAMLRTS